MCLRESFCPGKAETESAPDVVLDRCTPDYSGILFIHQLHAKTRTKQVDRVAATLGLKFIKKIQHTQTFKTFYIIFFSTCFTTETAGLRCIYITNPFQQVGWSTAGLGERFLQQGLPVLMLFSHAWTQTPQVKWNGTAVACKRNPNPPLTPYSSWNQTNFMELAKRFLALRQNKCTSTRVKNYKLPNILHSASC